MISGQNPEWSAARDDHSSNEAGLIKNSKQQLLNTQMIKPPMKEAFNFVFLTAISS